MVRQRYAQAAAHVGELCRIDIPDDTSHLHGTDERLFGLPQPMALATGFEYTTVEGCVMGRQKIQSGQGGNEFVPDLGERGRLSHVFPRQTVKIRKTEFSRGWTNQVPLQIHDATISNKRDPDRTSAIGTVIGGFKVDRREVAHTYPLSICHEPECPVR